MNQNCPVTTYGACSICGKNRGEAHTAPMTLDHFLNADEPWPAGAVGFRIGKRGRKVWQGAFYPEGCRGHLVCIYRGVAPTFTSYVDRDAEMTFVFNHVGCEDQR